MRSVQWATVTMSLGMILFPAWRTPQLHFATGVLLVTCTFILGWRLHRHGIGHMNLPTIWDGLRKSPGDAHLAVGPLDWLSAMLSAVVTNCY